MKNFAFSLDLNFSHSTKYYCLVISFLFYLLQVLVSLSYLVFQSSASAIASSRSGLSSSTARHQTGGPHLNIFSRNVPTKCDASNTIGIQNVGSANTKNESIATNNISTSYSPNILPILRSDCSTILQNQHADNTKPVAAVHRMKSKLTVKDLTILNWAEVEKAKIVDLSGNPSLFYSLQRTPQKINQMIQEFLGTGSSLRLMKLYNTQNLVLNLGEALKKMGSLDSGMFTYMVSFILHEQMFSFLVSDQYIFS